MTLTANHAIICYDNKLTSALLTSITPTSERTGFNVENAYDWYTTSFWSPTAASGNHSFVAQFSIAVSADYFAIYRHNLGTVGGTVVLEYSNDGTSYTTLFTASTADDNELLLKTFESVSATYWRVKFNLSSSTPFYVGVVMFGQKLSLYRGMIGGFVVPRHGRKNKITNQKTEGGQMVGRVKISNGAATNIVFKSVPQVWVRDYWEAFVLHAEVLPFIFSWNHTFHPEDACYCVVDGEVPLLAINENRRHDVTLPVQCLLSGS